MFKIYFRFFDGVPGLHHHVDCLLLADAQRMWDILDMNEDIVLSSRRP